MLLDGPASCSHEFGILRRFLCKKTRLAHPDLILVFRPRTISESEAILPPPFAFFCWVMVVGKPWVSCPAFLSPNGVIRVAHDLGILWRVGNEGRGRR